MILFWGIPYPESQDQAPWPADPCPSWIESWPERWALRSGGTPLEEIGCALGRYGAVAGGECSFPFAAVSESQVVVHARGPIAAPQVAAPWRDRLREFCEVLELPWSEPRWHLTAFWEP